MFPPGRKDAPGEPGAAPGAHYAGAPQFQHRGRGASLCPPAGVPEPLAPKGGRIHLITYRTTGRESAPTVRQLTERHQARMLPSSWRPWGGEPWPRCRRRHRGLSLQEPIAHRLLDRRRSRSAPNVLPEVAMPRLWKIPASPFKKTPNRRFAYHLPDLDREPSRPPRPRRGLQTGILSHKPPHEDPPPPLSKA